MVIFDATFLSYLFYPESRAPLDPSTNQAVTKTKERVEFLINTLERSKQKIIIPTPALSEILVVAPKAQEAFASIGSSRWFEIYPFDQKAAIECAEFMRVASRPGAKRELPSAWDKAKFDFQIIAIAIVAGVDVIYSDDKDIARYLIGSRMKVIRVTELQLPPPKQMPLYNGESLKEGDIE